MKLKIPYYTKIIVFILCFFSIFVNYAYKILKEDKLTKSAFYIDVKLLIPGQVRYSKIHAQKKKEEFIKNLWAKEVTNNKFKFGFNNNKSALPINKAIPVIKVQENGKIRYIALDGHHDIMANLLLGAKTIPVIIEYDFSMLSFKDAINEAIKKEIVYYKSSGGKKAKIIKSFKHLIDDPVRAFVSEHERRINSCGASTGANYVLWIKSMDNGRPIKQEKNFIEFIMTDELIKAGFTLNPSKTEEELVDEARAILLASNVVDINIVEKAGYFTDSNYRKYILELDKQKRQKPIIKTQ